ncbi:major capsid protein [Flintibacter sp. P01028]|uniref:major capsid protein n=1 Tax=Flintibacter sp. P01028 TaxID=3342382 RepID=UPI0035B6053F
MNRNTNSHFALNPTRIDMSRSTFDRNSSVKTSFNVGDIVPFYVDEVLPGDTFDIDTSKVIRMPSLLTPIMDNLYLDTYYFFVPNRIVWQHWKELMGENNESAWIPSTEYEIPQITAPSGGWNIGTIADYMGVPTGVSGLSVNALPFRAYALICNEWFRDENLCDPLNIPLTDATVAGVNTGTFVTDVAKGGLPYKAAKYRDYFTSCLPAPQKGPDVTIPVSGGANYPVMSLDDKIPNVGSVATTWTDVKGGVSSANWHLGGDNYNGQLPGNDLGMFNVSASVSSLVAPTNLWAINDGVVSTATINQLRLAFQVQKLYERDARGGTRYIEVLKSHFGVTSPDARLQRPEYLGGNRIPIVISEINQTSGTSANSTPQGNPSGQSRTTDVHSDFKKSFVEHGFIIGVMVARYDHTYQQGLERFWSRKGRLDFYWPVFANIGEQAVLNKEIYAQGSKTDDEVFGYQEAWADYRYKPNRVTGEMRSTAPQSLDVWHLGDDYSKLPSLSDSWIQEDSAVVNRVIAVSEENSNQLWADIFIKNKCTRAMPMYSIPGLIDHH